MLQQSSHRHVDRGLDAYFTPEAATLSLLALEYLPASIWEPACGDGTISRVLIAHGHDVVSSDIGDYQYGESGTDYLKAPPRDIGGIVTNPPFKLASRFAQKALSEAPYVALLLRTNFLEAIHRLPFFRTSPPSRIWISSRRLPMMHRHDWTGPRAGSNTCHAWFIWDRASPDRRILNWFDWREHSPS
jgi:hypothetical protein